MLLFVLIESSIKGNGETLHNANKRKDGREEEKQVAGKMCQVL
jgi:hypothetical protein